MIWRLQKQEFGNLRWNTEHAALLWRYGKWFWIGWVFSTVLSEYPKILAGSALGWENLGYLGIAFFWAQLPTGAITHVLVGLTNPVYAKYQHDRERLSLIFGKMLRLVARAAVFLALLFYSEAGRLTSSISGPQWMLSIELLRLMVGYALFRPFLDDVQALLLAVDRPRSVAAINGLMVAAALIGMPALVWAFGAQGLAMGVSASALLGAALSWLWATRFVDIAWTRTFLVPAICGGGGYTACHLRHGRLPTRRGSLGVGNPGRVAQSSVWGQPATA